MNVLLKEITIRDVYQRSTILESDAKKVLSNSKLKTGNLSVSPSHLWGNDQGVDKDYQ